MGTVCFFSIKVSNISGANFNFGWLYYCINWGMILYSPFIEEFRCNEWVSETVRVQLQCCWRARRNVCYIHISLHEGTLDIFNLFISYTVSEMGTGLTPWGILKMFMMGWKTFTMWRLVGDILAIFIEIFLTFNIFSPIFKFLWAYSHTVNH